MTTTDAKDVYEFSTIKFVVVMTIASLLGIFIIFAGRMPWWLCPVVMLIQISGMRPATDGGPWVWERRKKS